MSYLFTHLPRVEHLAAQHLALVASALAIALALAFPMGVFAARNRRPGSVLLSFLSLLYTVPSLALLAVLVRYAGLGFWTAVIVLVVYAQFVLVRNFAEALRAVPAPQVDAARGIGMSAAQVFWRVECPLALPVMLGGLRVATVAMIAIATLAAYASAGGLGELIFEGLSRQYPAETLAGSIPAALLAIGIDAAFRGVESYATRYAR